MLMGRNKQNIEHNIVMALGPFETYAVTLQRILLWDNPVISSLVLISVNICFMYWLVASFWHRICFVGCFSVGICFYVLWVSHIWPEIHKKKPLPALEEEDWTHIHYGVLSVPEIARYLYQIYTIAEDLYQWLKHLQVEHPSLWGLLITGTFVVGVITAIQLHTLAVVYTLVMMILIIPGVMVWISPFLPFLCFWKFGTERNMTSIEDYLPEETIENQQALDEAAHLQSYIITDINELSSLDIEVDKMPSMDDVSDESLSSILLNMSSVALGRCTSLPKTNLQNRECNSSGSNSPEIPFLSTRFRPQDWDEDVDSVYAQGLIFPSLSMNLLESTDNFEIINKDDL